MRSLGSLVVLVAVSVQLGAPAAHAQPEVWVTHGPQGGFVTSVAVDPSNPRTVYAGTSFIYGEIFRSTDAGATWVRSSPPSKPRINAIAIDPANPATVYAATDGDGVIKSTDRAVSWRTRTFDQGPFAGYVRALALDPSNPAVLYASTPNGVFKSTDGAESWRGVNRGLRGVDVTQLVVDPSAPGTVYAGSGASGVFKSGDGGETWGPANAGLPASGGSAVMALLLDPTAPRTLYAGTAYGVGDGVFKSTDGGASWFVASSDLLGFSVLAMALDPSSPSTLYAATTSGISRSTDGGASWTWLTPVRPLTLVRSLAIDPTAPRTIYAGTFSGGGGVFKSTDGGSTWRDANSGIVATTIDALAVDPQRPDTIYAGTFLEGVFKSVDGGRTWSTANTGLEQLGVRSLAIDPRSSGTVYAGTNPSLPPFDVVLFKTTDGGRSWQPSGGGLPPLAIAALAVDPRTPSTVYAGTGEGMFKSVDGAASWFPISSGLGDRGISAIAIDPRTPSTIYVSGVYKSIDGGVSWTLSNQGPASPRGLSLAIDPVTPSTLYAGDAVVAKSTDGGATWPKPPYPSGLPVATSIEALAVDPVTPSTVYAATSDYGVYRSTDGGTTWAPFGTGLERAVVQSLVVDPRQPRTVYAGTLEQGVFVIGRTPPSAALLENPQGSSSQSGLGVISGWVCDAGRVTITIDATYTIDMAYGTSRADTAAICGDTDNGFGALVNWNLFGDGPHTIVAFVDGIAFAQATFDVATFGTAFLRGAQGAFVLPDFPSAGRSVRVQWQEPSQSFVIAGVGATSAGVAGELHPASLALGAVNGVLENPPQASFQSGLGVVSGWVCDAQQVTLRIDGGPAEAAAYGSSRGDTFAICGDTDNGFGRLVNWNVYGDGPHTIDVAADGRSLGRATFTVTTLGTRFLRGASGQYSLPGFAGRKTEIRWQEALQNFTVVRTDPSGSPQQAFLAKPIDLFD